MADSCVDAPNANGLALYVKLLADIPSAELTQGIGRHLTESENRWFPAVGTLRRLAIESREGVIPNWEWAWNQIVEALKVWNQYDRESCVKARGMLSEELMWYVTSILGGFYTLANCQGDDFTVLQSNFRNAWTRRKEQAENLRKIPESLRPRLALPNPIGKNLEAFGNLER